MPLIVNVPIVFAPELATFPVTFPVRGPAKAVDVVVPDISSLVDGVVVPIPTLDRDPSTVIMVVVTPPSLTLKVMSVSTTVLAIIIPVLSTVTERSLSVPTVIPVSLTPPNVPEVVSLPYDLK